MVLLSVAQKFQYRVSLCGESSLLCTIMPITQTDIALPTVMTLCLSEISQQLSASADIIRSGVFYHRVNTLTELFLSLFVDNRRYLYMLCVFASLQIPHVRSLLLRYEVQDMFLAEAL